MRPANAARFAAQALSLYCPAVNAALEASTKEKIAKLEQADAKLLRN